MAKKRIRIGFVFGIDSQWIAGSYYLLNVLQALKTLPDASKPHLVYLCNESSADTLQRIRYPYFSFKNPYKSKRNYLEAAVNKSYKILTGSDLIIKQLNKRHIDLLFPASLDAAFSLAPNPIYWIPDFQHHHYPSFFRQEELQLRNKLFSEIAENKYAHLVLSSQTAYTDFRKFYPNACVNTHILPFAVTLPPFEHLNINELKQKYKISKPYYIVTNQFWQHKNHMALLKALQHIRHSGNKLDFQIVFTGKGEDYRAPGFYQSLITYVQQNELSEYCLFLGFIDRDEQLKLMQNSLAIIQPSMFEGWSTVVEDAKALNQYIILSNIQVHLEQAPQNAFYFEPENHLALADIMLHWQSDKPYKQTADYTQHIQSFGNKLLRMFELVLEK